MFEKIKLYLYKNTKFGKTRYLNFLYKYDLNQFFNGSLMSAPKEKLLSTNIRLLIHAIEKGLSLPNPKDNFGKDKIIKIISLNDEYNQYKDKSDTQIDYMVKGIVNAYCEFRKSRGADISFIPTEYLNNDSCNTFAGAEDYISSEVTSFEKIANSRHSSRSFSDETLNEEIIYNIVKLAQTAPSACNRQATRIYACTNKNKIDEIIKIHGGLNGFDRPGVIFAVTGDLSLYQNEFERNLVFVDGGIFVMNLLYSINSFGLLSCPIIWGSEPDMDSKIEDLLNIPHTNKVVALVVAGYPKNSKYRAAISKRRDTEEILFLIK